MTLNAYALIAISASALSAVFAYNAGAEDNTKRMDAALIEAEGAVAVFAGGCFWCVEADFDKVDGVLSTVSGYTGGATSEPTYKSHSADGHYEAVRVVYDPDTVSYGELVDYFWRHVDPTDAGGQFCDRGPSYRTAIFAVDEDQEAQATASRDALEASNVLGAPVVTKIETLGEFWPAETYHQDYYIENPVRYRWYRLSCGRDRRVEQIWSQSPPES